MIRRSICALAGLVALGLPHDVAAQRLPTAESKTVLFVCEHGTVKSLVAKVLFEQYAKEVGLQMRAESRGTRADAIKARIHQLVDSLKRAESPKRP